MPFKVSPGTLKNSKSTFVSSINSFVWKAAFNILFVIAHCLDGLTPIQYEIVAGTYSTPICLFCLCYTSISICWHTNMSFMYVGQHNIHLPDVHEEVSHKINNKMNSEKMSSLLLPFLYIPNQKYVPHVPGSLLCRFQYNSQLCL